MKKNLILLVVVFSAILLALVFILIRQNKQTPENLPEPTALPLTTSAPRPPSATPYPEVPEAIISPLLELLPYETDHFLVEYLPKSGEFYITIKKGSEAKYYTEAVVWLSQAGVPSPENNAQVRFLYLESY